MPITIQDLEDSLSLSELAETLKISRSSAERIAASGEIDVIRIGQGRGTPRFPRRSVIDYVNRRTSRAADNQR